MQRIIFILIFVAIGIASENLYAQTSSHTQLKNLFTAADGTVFQSDKLTDSVRFRTSLEFGFAGAKLREDYMIFSILSTNGFQWRNGIFAGIGSGVEFFDLHIVPLYADVKYNFFPDKKASPYCYVDYGYAFPFGKQENENEITGGQLFSAGFGIRGNSKKCRTYTFSVGYRYQFLISNFDDAWGNAEIERKMTYKRFFVKFGWFFY